MTAQAPDHRFIDLTVAMPAYNEVGSVRDVVLELVQELRPSGISFEILLVDDGSNDGTREVADRLAAEISELRVVHHERNLGLGAGWRTCVDASRGDWVFLQPADGQLGPSTVRRFYQHRGDSDVVVGIRGSWERSLHRRWLTTGFHFATRVILGVTLSGDYGVCFLFRGSLVRSHSVELVSGDRGVAVIVEWLFLAVRDGAKLSEQPAEVLPRVAGSSKGGRLDDSVATLVHLTRAAIAHRLLPRIHRRGAIRRR